MTRRVVALATVAVAALGCDPELLPPPPAVSFSVTGPGEIHALTSSGRLAVTVTIPGLLAESPLNLATSDSGLLATGFFELAIEEQQNSTATLRLYGTDDEAVAAPDVLLLEQDTPITLERALNTIDAVFDPVADGAFTNDPRLDVNRNGKSNYDDMLAGCSPGIPPPLLSLSSPLLQYSAVGPNTDRAVVVFSNAQSSGSSDALIETAACGPIHPEALRVSAQLLDAPGVVFETFVTETGEGGTNAIVRSDTSDTIADLFVRPREQTLINTAFTSPDDVRITGAVLLSAEHCRCGYTTQSFAAVVGNAQFPPQVVPADYQTIDLPPDDVLPLLAFPPTLLFSGQGLPITVEDNVADLDGLGAALAYVATVPAQHQLSVLLSDADVDLDLGVFTLDAQGDLAPITDGRSTFIGNHSAEGIELSFAETTQVAVVVGRKFDEPDAEPAGANLVVHAYGGPALSTISPFGGPVGGDTDVVLSGARFHPDAQVLFGGLLADDVTVAADGLSLTCTTPRGSLLPGLNPTSVTVQNPNGQSTTLPSSYLYWPGTPSLTSLSPLAVAPGGVVTLSGAGFANTFGAPLVLVDDAPAQVIGVSTTELLFVAPDGPASGSTNDVSVQNRVPQLQTAEPAAVLDDALAYISAMAPPPVLASIDPAVGPQTGGFVITATGADFLDGAELLIGPLALTSTFVDSSAVNAFVPPLSLSGVLDVRVRNPDGLTSEPLSIVIEPTVVQGIPVIELVTSQNGIHAEVPGDELQLFGSNLGQSDAVLCNISDGTTTFLAAVVGQSDLAVTCAVLEPLPEGFALTATVDFADGSSATSPTFFGQAPTITAVQTIGDAFSGADFSLVLTGQSLFGPQVQTVAFELTDGSRTSLLPDFTNSETLLTIPVPANTLAQASYQVFVTYPGGYEAAAPLPFSVGGTCGNDAAEGLEQCDGIDLRDGTCQQLGFETGTLLCDPGSCTYDTSYCGSCQDGKRDPGEQCDQSDLNGASCVTLGFDKGDLDCADNCFYDLADCSFGICGDFICDPDEDGTSCPSDCMPDCGDDVCAGGETCIDCANDCGLCQLEIVSGDGTEVPMMGTPAVLPQVRVVTAPTGVPVSHDDVDLEIQGVPVGWGASVAATGAAVDGLYNVSVAAGRRVGVTDVVTVAGASGAPIGNAVDITLTSVDIPTGTIVSLFNKSVFNANPTPGADGNYRAVLERTSQLGEDIDAIAISDAGDLYLAREVANDEGFIHRIDGDGMLHRIGLNPAADALTGVPGPAGQATFGELLDLTVAPDGTLYAIADPTNFGTGVLLAFTPASPGGPIDQDATVTQIVVDGSITSSLRQVRLFPNGDLLIMSFTVFQAYLHRLDLSTGIIRSIAPPCQDNVFDLRIDSALSEVKVASNGAIVYATDDAGSCMGSRGIYSYDPDTGFVARVHQYNPISLAPARGWALSVDETSVFVAPPAHHIQRFDATEQATLVVGPALNDNGYQGNDGPALLAKISNAANLTIHRPTGDLYFTDQSHDSVRMVRGIGNEGPVQDAVASHDTSTGPAGDGQTVLPTERLPLAIKVHIDSTLDGQPVSSLEFPVRITTDLVGGGTSPRTPWVRNVFGEGNTQALFTPGLQVGNGVITARAVDLIGRDLGTPVTFNYTVDPPAPGTVLRAINQDALSGLSGSPLPAASEIRLDLETNNPPVTPVAAHNGDVYVAETKGDRVLRLNADGSTEIFGGAGPLLVNGNPIDEMALVDIRGLAVGDDTLFISTYSDDQIRAVDLLDPERIANAIAGGGAGAPLTLASVLNDRSAAVDALSVRIGNADALAADGDRVYFISGDETDNVFAVEDGVIWRYAEEVTCDVNGGGINNYSIQDLDVDPATGQLLTSGWCNDLCSGQEVVVELVESNDIATPGLTVVVDDGNCTGPGRTALAIGPAGGVFVAVAMEHTVKRFVWPAGPLDVVVGTGVPGHGLVAPRLTVPLDTPEGLTFSGDDLVIADNGNRGLRIVHDLIGDLP